MGLPSCETGVCFEVCCYFLCFEGVCVGAAIFSEGDCGGVFGVDEIFEGEGVMV